MKIKIILSFVIFLVSVSGCVAVNDGEKKAISNNKLAVSSVWDVLTTVPKGSSIQITPHYLEQVSKKHPKVIDAYHLFDTALKSSLEKQGYAIVQPNAEYQLVFGVALADELNDNMISQHFGITPGLSADKDDEKGSFLVYIKNTQTGQRIWRATVQGIVRKEANSEQQISRTKQAVEMALLQFYKAR